MAALVRDSAAGVRIMFGYGPTAAGQGYGRSNDGAALGGHRSRSV